MDFGTNRPSPGSLGTPSNYPLGPMSWSPFANMGTLMDQPTVSYAPSAPPPQYSWSLGQGFQQGGTPNPTMMGPGQMPPGLNPGWGGPTTPTDPTFGGPLYDPAQTGAPGNRYGPGGRQGGFKGGGMGGGGFSNPFQGPMGGGNLGLLQILQSLFGNMGGGMPTGAPMQAPNLLPPMTQPPLDLTSQIAALFKPNPQNPWATPGNNQMQLGPPWNPNTGTPGTPPYNWNG